MQARTGGQIVVDMLKNYGVDTVFCVPGESYLAALDAFYDAPHAIRLITCRQEGGAAYMAEAHAKLTRQPGVCFVTRGPGAANAMVGIHTAFQDSTPLLLFIGQVERKDIGREAFQELDYTDVYAGVAKKVFDIQTAEQLPQLLCAAWQCALSGRPGPVAVVLPEDMLRDTVTVADVAKPAIAAVAPTAEELAAFGQLLHTSERPLLICGGAAWDARSSQLLREFSERQALPVVTAFRRQDSFDNLHPHYVGQLGLAPDHNLIKFILEADLIIALGARLGDITTSGYTLFPPDGPRPSESAVDRAGEAAHKLVHVHVDAGELNKVYRAELGLAAHPRRFLQDALSLPPRRHLNAARIARARQHYEAFVQAARHTAADLRMDRVAAYLRQHLPAQCIVASGAGSYTTWAERHLQFRHYPSQLAPTNGSMGYSVPASIAAKLLKPQHLVVCLAGDGCFLMNGQELATAAQYQLGIVFLVLNNHCYGSIRNHQQQHYPERPVATRLDNPDFVQLAKAYGGYGETIRQTGEFGAAFERAVEWVGQHHKPALLELIYDY